MMDPQPHRDPVEELAEAFLERYRRGERPSLSEYTRAHPELADEIRDLFPALVMMEEAGPGKTDAPGPCGRVTADGQELRRLGDYRILRRIGRGGMGVVYEAEQEALGRHVALKVLPFESAGDPTRLERFRRESRALARLHHTNIVPVFDVGVQEGIHYYAMQFIQGQSLDEVLAEVKRLRPGREARSLAPAPLLTGELASGLLSGQFLAQAMPAAGREPPLPAEPGSSAPASPEAEAAGAAVAAVSSGSISDVLKSPSDFSSQSDFHYYRSVAHVGLQVAEALAYAHTQKVLHRDIKPANLLLDLQGTIWVTDFGLAKDEGEDLTQTGDVVGTLRYMAPERFKGVSDPRSDLYSLGVTLYELLALRPAFHESDRARLIWRVSHEDPPAPRKLDRRLPRDLETIVLKAIAKEPGRRYQTAAEMAEDLRRFLTDRPIEARRSLWHEQAWRWCRRNPAVASLTGTVSLLLLVLALGGVVAAAWLKRERDAATDQLFESLLNQARAGRLSRQMGQRLDSLGALAKAACIRRDDRLRDEAIAALALPDLRLGPGWEAWPEGTTDLAFDPSYRFYARASKDGAIRICRLADHEEIHLLRGWAASGTLQFSPDCHHLAAYHEGTLTVWRLPDGRALQFQVGSYGPLAFSPDGRQAALGQADGVVFLDLATGQERERWRLPALAHSLAYHPDGKQLAVGYRSGSTVVSVFQAATGASIAKLPVGPVTEQVVAWHPDGSRLGVGSSAPRTQIWDVARQRLVATLEGHVQRVTTISFHPSGDLVATASWDGTLRLWDPSTGRQLLQLATGVWTPGFSGDGRYLGCTWQGSQAQLLEVVASREYRTLVSSLGAGQGGYYYGDISPEGLLAVGMEDGVRLWDLHTGRELTTLAGHSSPSAIRPLFEETGNGRGLIVGGSAGWLRWPLRFSEAPLVFRPRFANQRELRIGPPQPLPLLRMPGFASCTSDGRFLATSYDGAGPIHVLDLRQQRVTAMRGTHPGATAVALSPDGRWVATAGWRAASVRVWNAHTGAMVREWPGQTQVNVFFTPDSRTLVIASGSAYHFWAVDSWNEVRQLYRQLSGYPGYVAFTPDGRVMALEMAPGEISLMEVASGRTIARLQDPHRDRTRWLGFSADGAQLVAIAGYAFAVHIWELRLIRQRLREIGLDGDLPPSTGAIPQDGVQPLQVTVDPGRTVSLLPQDHLQQALAGATVTAALFPLDAEAHFRRGLAHALLGQWREARDACNWALFLQPQHVPAWYLRGLVHQRLGRQREAITDFYQAIQREPERAPALAELQWALELDPHAALAANNLAWEFAAGPAERRYLGLARLLAEKAVLLEPRRGIYRNTLGVVYYRLKLWRRAVDALQHAGQDQQAGNNAFDLYFLAMCSQQLGQPAQAREWYEKANLWWQAHPDLDARLTVDLAAFRAEAAAVLDLPRPAEPQGKAERGR